MTDNSYSTDLKYRWCIIFLLWTRLEPLSWRVYPSAEMMWWTTWQMLPSLKARKHRCGGCLLAYASERNKNVRREAGLFYRQKWFYWRENAYDEVGHTASEQETIFLKSDRIVLHLQRLYSQVRRSPILHSQSIPSERQLVLHHKQG